MRRVLHIVDSLEYAVSNCFQHQLLIALNRVSYVDTRSLQELLAFQRSDHRERFDGAVICLKQRTLHRQAAMLARIIDDLPVVVYDQDPWEAFRDGSPFKGTYELAQQQLNVKTIAITTKWWADFAAARGIPTTFVRMWVLGGYSNGIIPFDSRKTRVGFIGTIHPYRQRLFDDLKSRGINVEVSSKHLAYEDYLTALTGIGCFVHNEDSEVIVDGERHNLNVGLWIKDVEACSRGCFSIRNRGVESDSYLADIPTLRLYDDPGEIPGILTAIEALDPLERQAMIDQVTKTINSTNVWVKTATTLVDHFG